MIFEFLGDTVRFRHSTSDGYRESLPHGGGEFGPRRWENDKLHNNDVMVAIPKFCLHIYGVLECAQPCCLLTARGKQRLAKHSTLRRCLDLLSITSHNRGLDKQWGLSDQLDTGRESFPPPCIERIC